MTTERRMHFISGLPRSGSTLLSAILRQNPRFHASMSSPLAGLVVNTLQAMSAGSEAALLMDEAQKRQILRGLFDSFYAPLTAGSGAPEVIIDTNRSWTARLSLLAEMFPDCRVIACVRDVPWIMDSIERLVQHQPFENSRMFTGDSARTVYGRVEALARHDHLVGGAWAALKQAFYGELADRLLIVEYDILARAPEKVISLIYDFLGEPRFDGHDFANVEYDAPDFDAALGLSGLHKVRPKVALEPRQTILPPDLFKKFADMSFWRDPTGSRAHLIAAPPAGDEAVRAAG